MSKLESEILKDGIAHNRQQIKQAETEIARLIKAQSSRATGPGQIDKRTIPDQLAALQRSVKSHQDGIANLQHRLPQVEMAERVSATINAQNAQKVEADALAQREHHYRTVKNSARQEWLGHGLTERAFEEQWPSMREKIASEHAVKAAAATLAQPATDASQVKQAAQDYLGQMYAHNLKKPRK